MELNRLKFLAGVVAEAVDENSKKLTREAFIYMDPKEPKDHFAECQTCLQFSPDMERCGIFGRDVVVKANWSCGLYTHGTPPKTITFHKSVSPIEAGLVKKPVRCENCYSFDAKGGKCALYQDLNEKLPKLFKLDENVAAQGCCNAWVQK